jgi:hypothetical protein
MKQASTLTTRLTRLTTQYTISEDRDINWLQRLADGPDKSWAFFKRFLGIFCFGAMEILIGAEFAPIIQIPGSFYWQ